MDIDRRSQIAANRRNNRTRREMPLLAAQDAIPADMLTTPDAQRERLEQIARFVEKHFADMKQTEEWKVSDKKYWHLVQVYPIMYAFGYLAGSEVYDISATVERLENGSWRWRLKKWSRQGIEPSAEIAKQAAEEFLDSETENDARC